MSPLFSRRDAVLLLPIFLILLMSWPRLAWAFDFPNAVVSNLAVSTTAAPTATTGAPATTAAPVAYGPVALGTAGRARLLAVHNTGRASVDPPAIDMNRAVWSTDLANRAALALEDCAYRSSSSESIAPNRWIVELTSYSNLDTSLTDTLTLWYTIGEYYDYHQRTCSLAIPSVCGIYKLLVWSTMTSMGCAQHYCENLVNTFTGDTEQDKLYWKCNYENIGFFTNKLLRPYINGTVNDTCAGCGDDDYNWCDDGLCSSGCSPLSADCKCRLDPRCSGNGVLNTTRCECQCNNSWTGANCDECQERCQENEDLTAQLCLCSCKSGYETNPSTGLCEDVNECEPPSNHSCEHGCSNTQGAYSCTCFPGFVPGSDGRSCKAIGKYSEVPTVCGFTCNGNGILDLTRCECICSSGYSGSFCTEHCRLNDSKCWPTYETPPPVRDDDYCPRYCPQCACDESENNCEHNGTYAKVPGYEWSRGMCRCYCPYPWSGTTCQECNLPCANGGTLDADSCGCLCPAGFRPPDCSAPCTADISRWCTTNMAALCDRVPIIRENCPVMCKVCIP